VQGKSNGKGKKRKSPEGNKNLEKQFDMQKIV